MILTKMRMIVRPEKREEYLEVVRATLGPTRVEPGCISSCLYRDFEDENTFLLLGEWSSPEALQDHICRDHIRALLVAMDLLAEPPDVKFIHVAHTAGMEAIAAARNGLRQTSDERSQKMGI